MSCAGAVYSMPRSATRGGLLDPQLNTAGYRFVRLYKYGRGTAVTVGSVVLLAFRGPPPRPGMRARHGSLGKQDDSLGNLRWG